jgi:hypothetical protein
MRKLAMVLVLVVVMVPLVGAVAFAADKIIQCKAVPCHGSGNYNKILERIGNGKRDKIIPKGGTDLILANKYTKDRDVVWGSKGRDKIKVNDGDRRDTASGGMGKDDWCIVDSRSEAGTGCDKVSVR